MKDAVAGWLDLLVEGKDEAKEADVVGGRRTKTTEIPIEGAYVIF